MSQEFVVVQMVRAQLILIIFAALSVWAVEDGVRCTNGAFQHDCPNTAPVCCFNTDGSPAGCCSVGFECNDGGSCKPGPTLPANETAANEEDLTEDVHTTVATLVEVGAIMVAVLLLVFVVVFTALTLKRMKHERNQRQALLDAMPPSSDSDDEVTSETERALDDEMRNRAPSPQQPHESRLLRCCKCNVAGVNCLLFPCEHSVCCFDCAQRLKRCPDCKRLIRKRKKLFVVA